MTETQHSRTFKIALIIMAVLTFTMDVKSLCWESYAPDLNSELGEAEFLSKSVDAHSLFPANTLYDDTTSIICPEDIALYTDLNSCVAVINAGLNVTDPNSIISSLSWEMTGATEATSNGFGINQIGSYTFNEGTTVVTYRGATLYNNSINCTFTVTVTDNQAPRLISSPGHITVRNLPGECYANVSWTEPSAVDNCVPQNQLIYTSNYSSGQQFPVGSTRVEYRISDGVNTAFHSFTVTVIDAEAPEMIAPPAMESECGKPVPDAFTTWEQFEQAGGSANDNCSVHYGSFRYVGQTSSGITCPYTVTRIYSILDNDGNVSEVKHVIEVIGEGMAYEATVEATEPEVLLEPGAETQAEILFSKTDVSCKGSRTGVVDLTVNGTSGIVSFVWSTQNGSGIVQGAEDQSTLSDGDYTVMVYEDGVRLLAFDFSILVVDNQAPVLNAPATIQRKCGQYIPPAYSTWSDFANAGGTVSDNCQIYYSSFRLSSEVKSNPDCPYTLTRVYEITDVNGNRGVAEHLITVEAEEVILKSGMAGTFTAVQDGQWNDPATWGETVLVPTWEDDVIIPNGVKVTVDAAAVANNITIESGGELNHGVNLSTTVQVYGDWTNDGTYDGGTNGVVEFTGSGSASISGTTEFEGLIVNKNDGLSSALTIDGDVNVLSSGLLTMTSGLITIPGGSSFSVNPSIGLDIEYEAGFDVTGGSLATGDFTITNEGLIRIAAGSNVTLGDDSGNEVHTQFDGAFIVTGGDVDIAGRLYNSASGTLDPDGLNLTSGITISSGTVTLCTLGNKASSTGSLQVTSAGNFEFSGGTIVFQNPSTADSELDLGLIDGSGTKNITGGTFQFGNSNTPNGSIFHIDSEIKIPNIVTYSGSALFLDMPTDGASTVECINQATEPTPPVVQDNCGYEIAPIVPSGYVVTSYDGCEGDVTYTYTYEDCDGSTHEWVYTYTIDDTTAPSITGSIPVTTEEGCLASDISAAVTTVAELEALGLIISDACTLDANLTVSSSDAPTGTCPVVVTRTYTVTDGCGNSSTYDQTINIDDTTAPSITGTITESTEEGCVAGDISAAVTTVAELEALGLIISDACTLDANLTVSSSDASTGTCPVVVTRTYTVTDGCGNSSTYDQTINIDDTTAPSITGTIAESTEEGCVAGDISAAVTTVAELEALGLIISDACTPDANLTVSSSDAPTGTCPVVVTRTYTVTDGCGNSSTYDQTINIDDTTAPSITGTIAESTEEGCLASDISAAVTTVAELEALGLIISDACTLDANLTVSSSDAPTGSCPVVVTRTYTVTDGCGNSSTYDQTINIDDTTAPSITGTIAESTEEGCLASDISAAVTTVAELEALGLIISDACTLDANLTVSSSDAPTGSCPVVVTRTYTVTDGCGNSSTYDQTINIDDTTAPSITGTIAESTEEGCLASDISAAVTTVAELEALGLIISDACTLDANLTVSSSDASTGSCPVVVTRTYTVTDGCGNSSTYDQTINIDDTTAPSITGTIAESTEEGCLASDISAAVTTVAELEALGLIISDACTLDANLTVSSSDASTGSCPVVVTRTYTVTDGCGNSSTYDQTINIDDTTAPSITGSIPVTTEEGCLASDISAAVTTVAELEALGLIISDACTLDANLTVSSSDAPTGSCPVVVTRTYTVTDGCGNSSTYDQTINIDDTTAPSITGTIAESTEEGCLASDISAAVTTVAELEALGLIISDACTLDANLTVSSSDAPTGSCPVVVTRTYTVTDGCGNSSTYDQTINIDDTTAPSITGTIAESTEEGCLASDISAAVTTVAELEALGLIISDACTLDANLTVSSSDAPTGSCPVVVTRTYTVTDGCGNSSTYDQTINIDDTTAPSITGTIAESTEEGCLASDISAAVTTVAELEALGLIISDACTLDANLTVSSSDASTGSCPVVVTRTYTVTDGCGNSSTYDQTINIDDTTAPSITGSIPVTTEEGCLASDISAAVTTVAELEALGLIISDACTLDANLTVSSSDAPTGSCPVVVTRTYTVTDACGNSSAYDQTINIDDTTAPSITGTIAESTEEGCVAGDISAAVTTVAELEALGLIISDACTLDANLTVSSSDASTGTCPVVVTRTYTVTDGCGNSSTYDQIININDNILPTWTTTANNLDRTIECSDGSGLTAAQALAPVASDNCAGTISYTKNSGVFVPVAPGSTEGTYTNTWTAADACGNSTATVFTQVITIVDNTPPTITCPGNLTANTPLGVCGAVVTYTTPVGADNCAGATTVQTTGLPSGSTFPVGETINTFEVTDAAGNTNSCSFTVTVTDNRKPVLTLPATAIIACHESTHPDNTGWATATDNCAVDELLYTDSYGPPAVNCVNNYTIYRTWFANDIYGNEVTGIQEIRVSDVTGPDVVFNNQVIDVQCPDDIPVYYENLAEFIASAPSNGASDLCPGSVTLQLVDEYSVFDPATNSAGYCPESVVRIYRFYDECLNYTEIEQVINVDDLENCACSECVDKVNIHNVDLRSDPDSVWTLYNERRDKGTRCCLDDVWWEEGGKDPYRCVSFNVIIDDNAVGVQIETSKGQDVKEWRVDCENVSLEGPGKDIICLPSGEYHLFTHCKQGGDPIDYIIRSVRGIIESGDIETRVDCSREIHTTGDFESVPVWSALNPLYDKYLDTSDPYNPIFFVPLEDKDDVPSSIQYQVCADVNGYICGQAADGTICDTITVNVYDPIETLIDLGDVVMCAGTPIDVEPVISPAGNYTIEWFEGTGAIGTPIHTGYIHTIETPGWYSVKITEYESGLPCNESTSDFEVVLDLSKPGLSAPPDTLFLSCDDPNADQKIIDWRESAWAFIVDAYGDTVTIDVEDNYNTSGGINLVCNEVLDVEFKAVDPCSNDSIDIATIVVIDTTPPTITPASNSIADCNTLDHNTHEGYLAWLANHGGATASDNCQDPATLIWSDNVADVVWEGNGARDSITVTFTVTDDCDNSASTTATFIIVDDIPPVIECPPNVQDTAAENYCSKVPGNLQDPVYSDECSVPRLTWTSTGALVSAGDGTVAGIAFPVGVTVVTYTVTDDAGLTASCSFSVRIVDVTQPNIEIEGCQDVSETMGPDECYVIPTTINDPVYSDDCWPLSSLELSYTITGALNDAGTGSVRGKQFPVGVSTVEYTVTDPDGNSASCSFTVTMLRTDIPPAVISCPDSPEAVYATAGNCDAPVDLDSPTIDDPCATATYTISNDYNGTTNADDVYPVGITTVIWTITDNSGNETTCTQLVEVIDNQPPTITCQGDVEDLITDGGCDLESSLVTPPTYSDNCPNPVLTYVLTFEDGSTFNGTGSAHTYAFPVGKTQIHYTVTDAAGLKAECTYTVWIKNLDAPQFQVDCDVAIDVSVTSEAGQCGANVSPVPPGIINPCNEVYSITNSFTGTADASGFYPVGSTTVTWTIIDASGTEYTCEQLVEVIDNQPPVLTCQGDVEDLITDGGCDLESSLVTPPTYSDNCPNPVLTYVLTFEDGSTFNGTGSAHTYAFPVGKTQIHYTVTDAAGLKAECTYTVWIKNLDAPQFQVDCDAAIDVSVTSEADQCGANVSPVPPGIINPCNEVYSIVNSFTGTADASGFYPVGSTTVTWTIIDASGTEYTCEQLVEVIDNQPPVLTCQGDVEDLITNGGCDLESSLVTPPTYSDNCPNPVLTYVLTFEDGSTFNGTGSAHTYAFPVGKTQIHYTVTDAAGLKAECTYTVWIKNLDAPQFQVDCDVAIDVSVTSDPGQCGANVSPVPPGIINPCNEVYSIVNSFTGTADASGFYPVGSTTVTWTIIDASGTEYTCEQLVEVIDNQPPVLTCQGDVEDLITDGGCDLESSLVTPPTYSDNCPNPVLTYVLTFEDGSTFNGTGSAHTYAFPVGKTQIHYTVTDAAGLKAECTYTVWIKNLDAPQFQVDCDVAIDVSVTSDPGQCGANVSPVPPGIINPCNEVYSIVNSFTGTSDASGFYQVGSTTVTWTIIDASGTEYTCEQLVEVIDLPPFVNCPGDYEYQADFNLPYKENITVADPTYGDNCPNPVLEWTLVEPDGTTYTSATTGINILPNPRRYYVGVTTISYKITDSSGLTDDCSFTVTVTGPPDITCPPTYQTVTDPGVCTATRSSDDYELPTLVEGVQPITWTWTIYNPDGTVGATNSATPFVGSAANPGPPAIPDYDFETGTSRVHWYVENISGFDECEHLVIVTDKEPPVITADPYENCVDPLHWATYNESDPTPQFGHVDPNLIKSPIDYRTLIAGDTDLDLTSLTDNCCDSLSMINNLQWRIEFADTPDPITGVAVSHPDITGQGQPSDYVVGGVPKDIYLWGDGVTFKTVTHSIFYWIEDCNGNPVTEELRKEITITPRPQVIKTDY